MMTDTPMSSWKMRLRELSTEPTTRKTGGISTTVSRFYALLLNRVDFYLAAANGQYYLEKTNLTRQVIESAVKGETVLGVAAVSGTGTSRWVCLDVDSEDQWDSLAALARELAPYGHILLEKSRRGGHLWAFVQPTNWQVVRNYGLELADKYGLSGIEVFPKHGGVNTVRIPGSKHPKTGERYPILDPVTGKTIQLTEALNRIAPLKLMGQNELDLKTPMPPASSGGVNYPEIPDNSTDEFDKLVGTLSSHTQVRVYAPNRAIARCLWHSPDEHPSLYIKGSRFHCLSSKCGVWGDQRDLERWLSKGRRPLHD